MKHVHQWGNRENPPLILLHGMGSTGLSFGELAQYLRGYYVVSLDLNTEASTNDKAYLPSNMAVEIDQVVEKLDLQSFTLIGHSWGAHLAMYYAEAYPKKVRSLILLDGGYVQTTERDSLEEELENLVEFHNSVRFPSWEAFIESEKSELPRWSDDLEAASRSQVKAIDGEIRLALPISTAQAIVKGIFAEPTSAITHQVKCPVLLLRSSLPEEMEELREKSAEKFLQNTLNAKVRIIPNTTHDMYRDAPETVVNHIKDWVSE